MCTETQCLHCEGTIVKTSTNGRVVPAHSRFLFLHRVKDRCGTSMSWGTFNHSSNVLKCEFHTLIPYQTAKEAERVTDPGMGNSHSNLPEFIFSVPTKFRTKDINLHQEHYHAATNLGLVQSNMTWSYKARGP